MTEHERDARVSAAYRGLGREEPPAGVDAAILSAARRPRRRWAVPVSIAAVVVLAVGVTLRVQLERPPEAEPVALAPEPMSAPEPAARERRAAAAPPPLAWPERAADAAPRQEAQGTIAPASPPADRLEAGRASVAAKLAGDPETPGQWLERIARLREAGKHREADDSLAEFKRRHPDYEIAEAMRARIER